MNDIGFGQLTTNINFNLNPWIILNLELGGGGGECFICGLSSRIGEGTLASLQEIIRSIVGLLKWSSQSINYCYICKRDITWWFIILFSYADQEVGSHTCISYIILLVGFNTSAIFLVNLITFPS